MSIARGLERTSQRVARSTRRRPSISIASCALGSDLVVERLDLAPERAHLEHLTRDRVRAREYRRGRAGLLAEPERERGAGAIDELIGDDGRDDLPAQPVRAHLVAVALGQRWREVALEVVGQVRVLRQV